ncbi:beta-carotene 15,15'-monooxygenase [Chryseobacterium sp. GMJ5]|uniref:Beta-carotene 15,15'-monooxygenase n=1 Tax=Chryseobacterium gilvum TaxID=2976534 RepID=A0ABT2VYQ4_9FLAO|nr:beta-carotene 15,15'-monooxygenase [Chryseobacterium gilvum]MCU7615133.1 beta-carotene 15,15'-monooxygenase [Chryseobacterium gilvum]
MPEFDLDNFKKTWQEQPVQPKYNDTEILKMLNRKSRNYMKYIFWISVAEFLFFSIFGLFYIVQSKQSNSFMSILARLGVQKNAQLESDLEIIYLIIKLVSLAVTGYFVIKFYQNYRKIKIEEDLKEFILRIIKFKKTVNAFILINIILVVSFTMILTFFVFYVLKSQNITLSNSSITGFAIGLIISTSLCIILLWTYYRLVYGILIKRLDKNLKQLKNIEAQEI